MLSTTGRSLLSTIGQDAIDNRTESIVYCMPDNDYPVVTILMDATIGYGL